MAATEHASFANLQRAVAATVRHAGAGGRVKAARERASIADARDVAATERDTVADGRDETAAARDTIADARDRNATERDTVADGRDKTAAARDTIADARDRIATQREALIEDLRVRLEAANRALRERNSELRDFASVISHDLRAPLRRLQIFAEMAADIPGKDPEVADLLGRMRASSSRMEELVVDLLSYARVGASAAAIGPVDLGVIAREVVEELQGPITESSGLVHVGRLPTIEGDSTLLRQLFTNLVGNAVKFRQPDRPPVVTIAAGDPRPDGSGRAVVEITVTDNGIGFDPEHAERIFRIFERLKTDGYPGTGVGLAICRKITTVHDGSITAASTPGEGTQFTVILPVEQAKEQPDAR